MPKKISDHERIVSYFTSASEMEALSMMETINAITRTRFPVKKVTKGPRTSKARAEKIEKAKAQTATGASDSEAVVGRNVTLDN